MSQSNNVGDLITRLIFNAIVTRGDDEPGSQNSTAHQCDNPNCIIHARNKPSVLPEKDDVTTFIEERDVVGLKEWCQDVTKVNLTYGSLNCTPLFHALKAQWIDGMEILLTNSASPNFCRENSLPPIFIAASDNLLVSLAILLKHNAKLDMEVDTTFCKNSLNVLEYLCYVNRDKPERAHPIATFTYLTNLIANSTQYDHLLWKVNPARKNLLHICVITDTLPFLTEILRVMMIKDPVKTKQYINMFSKSGCAPLHYAVRHDVALVSVLCVNGANVDERMPTAEASTPSELAENKSIKIILNGYRMIQRSDEVPPLVDDQ